MSVATRWQTARKDYRCADAYMWVHSGRINRGDRYALVTVLRSDVVQFGTRARYCSQCAVGHADVTPDPRSES
jgi:hypothetical protein